MEISKKGAWIRIPYALWHDSNQKEWDCIKRYLNWKYGARKAWDWVPNTSRKRKQVKVLHNGI